MRGSGPFLGAFFEEISNSRAGDPGEGETRSVPVSRPEPAREGCIELVGRFHAQVLKLAEHVGGIIELSWRGAGRARECSAGCPENRGERGPGCCRDRARRPGWTAAGAGGPEAWGGHLDLLVGRALDGDLAGGLAPDRGHDHQPVRPQRNVPVAGRSGCAGRA